MEKLSAKNYECIPLKWDTEYFGISSARVNLLGVADEDDIRQIMEFCQAYEFVTIANLYNRKENNLWIGQSTKAYLTDINMQFVKQVSDISNYNGNIQISNNFDLSQRILDIAKEAFVYSRFFNDPRLDAALAAKIYRQWTLEAFKREDKYFCVYFKDKIAAGFLLFNIDKGADCSLIELVAVDKRYRGQKIGVSLLNASETFIGKAGISKIKVGTQGDNTAAMQLYTNCGFKYSYCSSIYHYWPKSKREYIKTVTKI